MKNTEICGAIKRDENGQIYIEIFETPKELTDEEQLELEKQEAKRIRDTK